MTLNWKIFWAIVGSLFIFWQTNLVVTIGVIMVAYVLGSTTVRNSE